MKNLKQLIDLLSSAYNEDNFLTIEEMNCLMTILALKIYKRRGLLKPHVSKVLGITDRTITNWQHKKVFKKLESMI